MQENAPSASQDEIVGIKNLEAEFDAELAKELAKAFLEDTNGILDRLDAALTQRDQEAVRKNAHMLKGTARAIQAWKCEKTIAAVENNARDGDLDSALQNMPAAREAYLETEKFLKEYLA